MTVRGGVFSLKPINDYFASSSTYNLHLTMTAPFVRSVHLITGDKFEKLDEPDEQGWCKGRLNGRVGLYPAKYATDQH